MFAAISLFLVIIESRLIRFFFCYFYEEFPLVLRILFYKKSEDIYFSL